MIWSHRPPLFHTPITGSELPDVLVCDGCLATRALQSYRQAGSHCRDPEKDNLSENLIRRVIPQLTYYLTLVFLQSGTAGEDNAK